MKGIKRITAFVLCLLMLFASTSFGYAEGEIIPETSTMPEMDALASVTVDAEPEESAEADILAEPEETADDSEEETVDDSEAQTTDEYACDCEYPPESGNIADHVDGCKRKTYIKSLFEGKTAEEIYAGWNDLDSTTQTDLLNMLEKWDASKYAALKELIDNGTEEPEEPVFPDVSVEGVRIGIEAAEGVFPEGTTASISTVEEAEEEVAASKAAVSGFFTDYSVKVLSSKVVDISFACNGEEVQPNGKVLLGFDIESIHSSAENIAILHIADDGTAELLALQNVYGTEAISLLIETEHFSHYVILQSETTYKPTLLRDFLKEKNLSSRYSIVEFPVTLNDFDAVAYNNQYGSSGLWFTTGAAGTGMNLGALPATQGIVEQYLSSSGYPVTHGSDRGEIIFGTDAATGKIVHKDVQFEFVYDNQTGYYTYNSGANHAQYNASKNRVDLYADTLAPYNYRTDLLGKITANTAYAKSTNSGANKRIIVNTQSGNNIFRIVDKDFLDVDTDNYTHIPRALWERLCKL